MNNLNGWKSVLKVESRRLIFGSILIAAAGVLPITLSGCGGRSAVTTATQTIQMPHMHGLSFTADGSSLVVPAHIGLMVYRDGAWSAPDVPKHDYMGYSGVNDGFYSSGHPDLTTDYPPLLGLVRSINGGQSFESLAFMGESDFHVLAAGYNNHVVYLINPRPNSELLDGMYYSLDDGSTWNRSSGQGLNSSPFQLAAHPTQAGIVAAAGDTGAYLSTDFGDTFTLISAPEPVSAITFDPDGSRLVYGYDSLNVRNMVNGEITTLTMPNLSAGDGIAFIALSPVDERIAVATLNRDIYLSLDGGSTWAQIAQQGLPAS